MALSRHAPLTLWRLTDGKPGHEKQSLGLARALERLAGAVCHDIGIQGATRAAWLAWLLGRFPAGAALPNPDLILAAGHATHVPALAARRARGGRIIVLMRPSLPLAWFDLCLIPAHDEPRPQDNVLVTRGVLNAVETSDRHAQNRGLILIGGTSRHYRWDNASIAAQVREVVAAQPNLAWTLTTSRRTPADFLASLGTITGLKIEPYTHTPSGWLEAALAQSAQVWVSPDSGSMVYEALTAGCQVGVFELTPIPGSRLARDVARLREEGFITTLTAYRLDRRLKPPPTAFNEAERCARAILQRWYA